MTRTPQIATTILILVFLFGTGPAAFAHRLDEYLQATLLTVRQDHIDASMRLIPGVSVAGPVIASIDTNNDGVLSQAEQQAYAERVISDLRLTADGDSVMPKLISETFPSIAEMRDGLGEIHIQFCVPLPNGGVHRSFAITNHHQNLNSVYLVNVTVPEDPSIHILAQKRNEQQSVYELDYDQTDAHVTPNTLLSSLRIHLNSAAFITLFRLGMRHIAEGTDHLLFLLALLLVMPVNALRQCWASSPTILPGLLRVLKLVTAFTAGHSVTLALAALGFLKVPARPIEVFIAVSILVSAIHALRPIFPGKEAAIAAFFGLIHGLAFASALKNLGLAAWERLTGILAFNLGIETMQILVVAAVLPSLLLMSRTRVYPYFRVSIALFAALASMGWIAERVFDINMPVDIILNAVARHALMLATVLFLLSLACWGRSFASDDTCGALRKDYARADFSSS